MINISYSLNKKIIPQNIIAKDIPAIIPPIMRKNISSNLNLLAVKPYIPHNVPQKIENPQ